MVREKVLVYLGGGHLGGEDVGKAIRGAEIHIHPNRMKGIALIVKYILLNRSKKNYLDWTLFRLQSISLLFKSSVSLTKFHPILRKTRPGRETSQEEDGRKETVRKPNLITLCHMDNRI